MKKYNILQTVTFCLFFVVAMNSYLYAQVSMDNESSSVIDNITLINSFICKECESGNRDNYSCSSCLYDNVTLYDLVGGEECECSTCSSISDNFTSNIPILDNLFNTTCQSCTCDNATVRHLKEMFITATDYNTCKNKSDLLKFPKDTYLEKCVRQQTGLTRWPITCAEAEKITMLKCNDTNITSLDGIEQLVNLKLLDMGEQGTKIDNLMPVRNLKHLQRLEIPNSEINNIEYLTRLPMLNTLNLSGNHVTDLTYFPYMYPLYQLVLNYQGPDYITDISPLQYMPRSLQQLSIQGNKITDISPLAELKTLKYLSIRDNRITSIDALDNMTMMSGIDMSINAITDITPLQNNLMLNTIIADHNNIISLDALIDLNRLGEVSFKHNYISDISPVADKRDLKSMIFDFNSIQDVTPLRDIKVNTYILSLRFTYNCIPEENYRQIRYLYKIQDVHFENQCENYPPEEDIFIDGENVVNVDMITGEVWDNSTEEEKDISMGTGCSIVKSKNIKDKSTKGDIVIILAFVLLLYKFICKIYNHKKAKTYE